MELEQIKQAVVDAIEDIKGFDINVMDVRKLTSMASYMIIASASSSRQSKALAHNVSEKLKALGVATQGIEGEREGEWVLLDLGEVIVHIMLPTARAYYNLEQLWSASQEARQSASRAAP